MMERIGNHLTYMSKYATGSIAFQCSEEVQKVRLMYSNTYALSLRLLCCTGPDCDIS